MFNVNDVANRLDSSDAEYVEVIHTDIANLGIGAVIGDVDFYPNGGTGQPSCLSEFNVNAETVGLIIKCVISASICDHNLVVNFFVESLNSDRLWGRRCTNLAEMEGDRCAGAGASMGGEPSNSRNNLNGIFRMRTNPASPFGVGQF